MRSRHAFVRRRVGKLRRQLPYLPHALSLVWQAARGWTAAWALLLVLQGVLPVAMVYLTRALVNSFVAAAGVDVPWQELQRPLLLALSMAGLMVVGELMQAVSRLVRTAQGELVRDHIKGLIHRRAVAADLGFFESPEYHDQLHRARIDASRRPLALIENLGTLIQNALTLAAMAAVLVPFGWWVPAALLASTGPGLLVVFKVTLEQHRWWVENTPRERRSWYLEWLLTDRGTAAEVRLFGLGPLFRASYQDLRRSLRGERMALARWAAVAEIAAGSLGLMVMGAMVAWMVVRALEGAISLGELAMFAQAFYQGQRLLRSLLDTVGQVFANILFLENLFEFLELEPQVVDPPVPVPAPDEVPPTIRFRDIRFRYPSSERWVFDGFDLTVPAGQLVALIGLNGAGKSTLFKLLCRLYDPQDGRVELGSVDIRELSLEELRGRITVLFQEPVHFSETVRRNVELAAPEGGDDGGEIREALRAAGAEAFVARLPEGEETLLGTWFAGGAELSVGEWQRLALARAVHRKSPVLLLDEPTSAMDSWSEADWVRRFRALAEGRTTMVITHRLTTARSADVIHVMEHGRIVESGNHDQLVAAGGRYAEAWLEQVGG